MSRIKVGEIMVDRSQRVRQAFGFILLLGCAFTAKPWIGLLVGLAVGCLDLRLVTNTAFYARALLTVAVVGLGFVIPLDVLYGAGTSGFALTAVSIVFTFAIGVAAGAALKISRPTVLLISAGTAICGASAIAAVSRVIKARDEEIAVAAATVFLLNSAALFLFPPIGHFFAMDQTTFGAWSGVAIHDTSSVTAAAAIYGSTALAIAVPVKLARVIWIVPLCFVAARLAGSKSDRRLLKSVPLFLYLIIPASLAGTYLPLLAANRQIVATIVSCLMTASLFFIGAGINRRAVSQVGLRPLALGVGLWILVAVSSGSYLIYFGF